ncbi:M48 family metalloprotease [Alloalcanivorax marinus]|uniref:M48 family metalloprotease n=1 Tax=Alloalcanivorax marinus TaxID=1177169 RepID=UPI00195EA1FE|nr:M48 family metalloprotease [Alloalcanivorax marinus]MBM7332616.1 M48 family metalloprotease [Alloalcanivorax marinus]
MDFFDHQARARRRTVLLVGYFLAALAAVAASVNVCAWLIGHWLHPDLSWRAWLLSDAGLWLTAATLAVLIGGSLRKAWQLRDGGPALARLLGAREVPAQPGDARQRRLLRVVEEMSLAAGTVPPRSFVLEREDGINALVAGLTPSSTVLVVTRGALERLSRDELQGVVAHEFSHILNADMRLNLRLLAALAGVLAIGKVGEFLLHATAGDGHRRGLPLFALGGALLMAIGFAGLFFGRLIKAAISRQRERLADASAVQFTRQPAGLAGALIKIRQEGSHLHSLHAEDLSHMAFAETLGLRWRRLLATHPSLDQRLRALGADWPVRARVRTRQARAPSSAASTRVGHLDAANLGYARSLLASIPVDLQRALHTQEGAECVLYALVLGDTPPPPALRGGRRGALVEQVRGLGTRLRLPLLDLAVATLRQAPERRRPVIVAQLQAITRHRGEQDLLCRALSAIARQALTPTKRRLPGREIHRLSAVANEIQVVFSVLAWAGDSARTTALAGFQRATHGLLPPGRLLLPPDRCGPARLQTAVDRLNRLTPLLKAPLIDAAADLVLSDGQVQVAEAELLRALGALLDCPMPPLFRSSLANI